MGNWDEFIIYIIIGLFMFGGWIINTIKAANDSKQKKADAQLAGDEDDVTAEELAARMRQSQRSGQSTASASRSRSMGDPDAAEPGNMTMAERIARAKAKQQYEQRQRGPQSLPDSANAQRSPDAHETRQREMQAQREARARSSSQQQQRQASQRQASRQGLRSNAATRRQSAAAGTDPTQDFMAQRERARNRLKKAKATAKSQAKSQARQPARSPIDTPPSQGRSMRIGKLRRSDLRRAIVMKEILDKPIANRDPLDAYE